MTLLTARNAVARARIRHDRYLDHLIAQGHVPTVEQHNRLDSLNAEREAATNELERVLVQLVGRGVAA